MNRDDRLFAIIGGAVVTAAVAVILAAAGGITGSIGGRPTVRVEPIGAASHPEGDPAPEATEPTGVVEAAFRAEPAAVDGGGLVGLLTGLSRHPQWAAWVVTDDLLRRVVDSVEAIADGYSPTEELSFAVRDGRFLVREDGGRLVIAAGTFRRYQLAVEVLQSIDAADLVAIYRRLAPEIEALRADNTWHRGDFEDRLREAVDHLLAVDLPDGPLEVERRTTCYVFADDRYERLSNAQRQLLRMGRANAAAIQESLREIRAAFGWPEPAAAPAPVDEPPMIAAATAGEPEAPATADSTPSVVEPMISPWDPRVAPSTAPMTTELIVVAPPMSLPTP